MKRNILPLLMILLTSFIGSAQNFDKAKLDSYFNLLEEHNKFMGSVAISENGEIVYTKTIGYADIENDIKANTESKYRIGSISKTFTSVLVLQAVEKEKLSLSQTIETYFPDVPKADKITIQHLLSHRSGIHNFTNDEDYLTWNTQAQTKEEMVAMIAQKGSDFKPGSRAEYSNSNFVLLTYILENVYQKPYGQLVSMYITEPIGLKNTYLGGKINPENNECKSYRFSGSWQLEAETDISIPLGAGGIVSTPGDLVRFSDALFGEKLVNKESLDLMITIEDGYGIGLFQIPFHDRIAYGHTGGIDGFSSIFAHFSNGNISYALVSNGSNFNNNDISIAVLSAIYDKAYELPTFKVYDLSSEDLDKYLGAYSSKEIPLKISITKDGNILIAQATGQASFPLDATEEDIFQFDPAGIVMEFNPTEKSFVLKQGGGVFTFTKE